MNINTEKENLFSLSCEPEVISPYLSPLMRNDKSQDFQEHEQFEEFHLIEGEVKEQNFQLQQNQDLNLDLLMDHKSTPEADLMQYSASLHVPQKKLVLPLGKKDSTKIYSIINFLIDNDELSEFDIKQAGKSLYEGFPMLEYIFTVMITKFKKLKKTKQQMTKFCMRKAFKYVSDHQSLAKKKFKNPKQDNDSQNLNFQMPFRKNSTQKTMNTQFLKQVFSKPSFVEQYKRFLQDFRDIINKDNQYKIKYLSDTIEEYISSDNLKKIEQIKRLPWTRSILTKTEQLAYSLLNYADQKEGQFDSDKQ